MNDNAKMGMFTLCGVIGGAVLAWTIRSIRAEKEVAAVITDCESAVNLAEKGVNTAKEVAESAAAKEGQLREQLERSVTLRNELEAKLQAWEAGLEKEVSIARAEGYLEGERDAKAAAKPPKAERPPRPRPQPRPVKVEEEQ